ncbi:MULTISPECIES: HTH-type transcriptional activator RhaS [Dickeya]|uniref:HTH-type transcriptional activator RhaS n=2 Tax=Dickeya chrysanthemi TaxID=556 RepID=C6CKQ2_DICC1|nr:MULTISPECIES: HTH-type transcriptional activator RhaS [Dickeya]ACT08416.1 transcriptional regulator, AraC family [Dickeya chrysanthemi Ech1591]MBX9445966.1 HTH-type transcriptional activator RhaS [Dickeya chrysanthemi]MCA7009239.1 HTH-type transcriptional activator RhaS [Dickeya chrysanthemi]TYL42942.1 HTH-type transcriptional activator RhaS [Dickeya sp. ws52]WJM85135.1 HTH-type transcriptional activator RhaS [Dickeya chrysanthemi]
MTQLHGEEFFASQAATVAVEPRMPQGAFPEHYHDFWEIVLVEQGAGVHVFNDQPFALCSGAVFFVRDNDRHLFEQVEELHLTNVLYRSPRGFRFLSDIAPFLPYGANGEWLGQWQLNAATQQQVKQLILQLAALAHRDRPEDIATSESLFLQILVLLRQKSFQTQGDGSELLGIQALLGWLQHNYCEEVDWETLADRFSLSLRTLHRQVKQRTGMTPQRYLNRLRLLEARRRLQHSDDSITTIAHDCGFSDSNHFSTQFRKAFSLAPKALRHQALCED